MFIVYDQILLWVFLGGAYFPVLQMGKAQSTFGMCGNTCIKDVKLGQVELIQSHTPSIVPNRLGSGLSIEGRRNLISDILDHELVNINSWFIRIDKWLPIERVEVNIDSLGDHSMDLMFALVRDLHFSQVFSDVRLPVIEIEMHENVVVVCVDIILQP